MYFRGIDRNGLNYLSDTVNQGEKVKKLEQKGVSPVIGEILLIAVVVALAAIVATLVGGLGGRGAPPSVMLTVTAKATDNNVTLSISHNGGDDLNISDLKIQGENKDGVMVTITNLNPSTGTLSVGGTMTATYNYGVPASGQVIQVFVIHNPSKQKLFSSSSITVQ
jgi:flagellin-like protein